MEAANCGAMLDTKGKGVKSIGIGVRGLNESKMYALKVF
jgi:hypothetical protein